MSEITIKDADGDRLTIRDNTHGYVFYMSCSNREFGFTDPAELKRLAEFILENLEEKK